MMVDIYTRRMDTSFIPISFTYAGSEATQGSIQFMLQVFILFKVYVYIFMYLGMHTHKCIDMHTLTHAYAHLHEGMHTLTNTCEGFVVLP